MRKARFNFLNGTVCERHVPRVVEHGLRVGAFDKAHGITLFVAFHALEYESGRLFVKKREAVSGTPLLHVGFRQRRTAFTDEVRSVRVLCEEIKIRELFTDHHFHHGQDKRHVSTGANRHPFHVPVADVGHAGVDGHHLGTVFTRSVHRCQRAHGAPHGAADQKKIPQMRVVRFQFPGTAEPFAEHPVASPDTGSVAGRGMADVVRGSQREREPLTQPREAVARHHHTFFPGLFDDRSKPGADFVQRLIPRHFLKAPFAPFADAL